jgi:hypothetical protein
MSHILNDLIIKYIMIVELVYETNLNIMSRIGTKSTFEIYRRSAVKSL